MATSPKSYTWNGHKIEYLLNSLNSYKASMGLHDQHSNVFSTILEILEF